MNHPRTTVLNYLWECSNSNIVYTSGLRRVTAVGQSLVESTTLFIYYRSLPKSTLAGVNWKSRFP